MYTVRYMLNNIQSLTGKTQTIRSKALMKFARFKDQSINSIARSHDNNTRLLAVGWIKTWLTYLLDLGCLFKGCDACCTDFILWGSADIPSIRCLVVFVAEALGVGGCKIDLYLSSSRLSFSMHSSFFLSSVSRTWILESFIFKSDVRSLISLFFSCKANCSSFTLMFPEELWCSEGAPPCEPEPGLWPPKNLKTDIT